MSKKSDKLLDRIARLEDKLLSLKCEYNMLLCKEDHDGNLEEFAMSMTSETSRFREEDEGDGLPKTFVLVPPRYVERDAP